MSHNIHILQMLFAATLVSCNEFQLCMLYYILLLYTWCPVIIISPHAGLNRIERFFLLGAIPIIIIKRLIMNPNDA